MAFDGLLAFNNCQAAVALVGFVSCHFAAFQSGRHGKGLHCGTGLKGTGNTVILPQRVQLAVQGILIHGSKCFFINYSLLELRFFIDYVLPQQHVRISGFIQIVKRIAGHGQHISVIYIHDDTAGIIGAVSFSGRILIGIIVFLQLALHDALDVGIQGGNQVIAVHRRLGGPLQVGIVVHVAVFPAVYPAENIVIVCLQPVISHIVLGSKADDVTGQRIVGIYPPVLLFKPDALDILSRLFIVYKLLERRDFIIGQLFLQYMVLGGGIIRTVFADFRFIHVKALGQRRYGALHIFFFFIHQLTVQNQVIHLLAHCQLRPLGIQDFPPLEGNRPAGILLLGKDLLFILLAVVPVDQDQSGA